MNTISKDPKLINSAHNGFITKDCVTVELCIYRLEHTLWTLEVVDSDGTSTVWDDEFESDDAAYAEFRRAISRGMLEFQSAASKSLN